MRHSRQLRILGSFSLISLALGCGHPNQANIQLRKQIQSLDARLATLKQQHDADQWTIAGLEKRIPTVPMLKPAELKNLWVTHGLQFGRLTGGIDLDPRKPGDEGLRVYISPIDEDGLPIQAAGSFVIEAFDLAQKGDNQIGRWTWTTQQAKAQWREFLIEYTYALTCPWQKTPKHPDISIRVTFTDELTHIPYVADKTVRVNLPPPVAQSVIAPKTAPATQASH